MDNICAKRFHYSRMLKGFRLDVQVAGFRSLPESSTLLPITRHHPVTQYLIRRLDAVAVNQEFLQPGILRDKLQTKLKILETLRAQVADRLLFLQRFIHQQIRSGIREPDLN